MGACVGVRSGLGVEGDGVVGCWCEKGCWKSHCSHNYDTSCLGLLPATAECSNLVVRSR